MGNPNCNEIPAKIPTIFKKFEKSGTINAIPKIINVRPNLEKF